MIYYPLGYMGYFGTCAFSEEANKLVDEYNLKINTFENDKQNYRFSKNIRKKMKSILKYSD